MHASPTDKAPQVSTWRIWLVAVGIPAVAAIIAITLSALWYSSLPDPIAVHWGLSGTVDGFGPRVTYLVMVLAAWGLSAALSVPVALHVRSGAYGPGARFTLTMSVWVSLLLFGVAVGAQQMQRGVVDAAQSASILPTFLFSALAATALALVVYAVLPGATQSTNLGGVQVEPMKLAPSQTGAWSGSAVTTPWITIPVAALAVGSAVLAAFTASVEAPAAWLLLGVSLLLVATLLVSGSFRVSVGAQGLVVRSYLGWPSRHVPLDEVADVSVTKISPLAEWGGYGWRVRPGGTAIITRRGLALQVTQTGGKVLAITVDDPTAAASLLSALTANDTQR